MVDYRFPTAGVDARFATLGADAFFPSAGTDARFATAGKDLRFEDPGFGSIPPLDSLPAPLSGYSLRKIRTAYAGQCLRVRRSSDNTEQDIGFAGTGVDTAALLAFCGAGNGFVRTWYDQSGNARDLVQATQADQPRIVTSGSYLGEIRPDSGTVQRLQLTNAAFALHASPLTLSSVLGTTAVGAAALGLIASCGTVSGARMFFGTDIGTRNLILRPSGVNILASPMQALATSGNVLAWTKTATADASAVTSYHQNGSGSAYSSEAFTATDNSFGINGTTNPAVSGIHGHKELILWNSVLSGADRQALARNQGAYFGIAVA